LLVPPYGADVGWRRMKLKNKIWKRIKSKMKIRI